MQELTPSQRNEVEIAHTAAIIEDQLRSGFLLDIASAKVDVLPESLAPYEVAEVILPQPKSGEPLAPRWTFVEKAEADRATKDVVAANGEDIMSTVETLQIRKLATSERQDEAISKIVADKAVFICEGGANKTSVVRRGVAVKAMRDLYGNDLSSQTLYQFGSDRLISPIREVKQPDGSIETVANAEHATIRSLAGDQLDENEAFTEFDANLATALAEGYEIFTTITMTDNPDGSAREVELVHPNSGYPKLIIIQPAGKGLEAGFDSMGSRITDGSQLVIATNGQYREKDIYQAEMWAEAKGLSILPAVALGDEPGDKFPFGNEEIVVPNRPETAYINELIIIWRLAMKRLPDFKPSL